MNFVGLFISSASLFLRLVAKHFIYTYKLISLCNMNQDDIRWQRSISFDVLIFFKIKFTVSWIPYILVELYYLLISNLSYFRKNVMQKGSLKKDRFILVQNLREHSVLGRNHCGSNLRQLDIEFIMESDTCCIQLTFSFIFSLLLHPME